MKTPYRFGGLCSGLALLLAQVIGEWISTTIAVAQEVGEVLQDYAVCPEIVVIPPGSFLMGFAEVRRTTLDHRGAPTPSQHRVFVCRQCLRRHVSRVGCVCTRCRMRWTRTRRRRMGPWKAYCHSRSRGGCLARGLANRTYGGGIPAANRSGVVGCENGHSHRALLGRDRPGAMPLCKRIDASAQVELDDDPEPAMPGPTGPHGASRLLPTECIQAVRCTCRCLREGGRLQERRLRGCTMRRQSMVLGRVFSSHAARRILAECTAFPPSGAPHMELV